MHKVNKIDHICIAVKDLEQARKKWEPILGKSEPDDPYVDETAKINVARYWLGDVGFELMASTSPDGEVAKFIEKRGEGIYLIGFNVDNTRESVAQHARVGGRAQGAGLPLRRGALRLPRLRVFLRPPQGGQRRAAGAHRLQVAGRRAGLAA
jgi:catechol 2,3-dioxygenase-like lactoylglutathione lyase family enzyme